MRAELIERAKGGDREAFARLAADEVDQLLVVARLILRDSSLAEDAVQEALLRCWRQLPKLREIDRFDGWLYRILVNAANDESKRRRRFALTVAVIDAEPLERDAIQTVADREQLERGFRRLSINHRAVVVLHQYADLPLTEVARALGIPEGTAKSRYHYAMAALRSALEADDRLTEPKKVPA